MKSLELKGNLREAVGKKNSKGLRKEEKVPCVMYGQGENVHFELHENSFNQLVYTPNAYIVDLDLDGKVYKAVIREVQFHPVSDKIIHADFFEIAEGKFVTMQVPVTFEGVPAGVLAGGRKNVRRRNLTIKALPKDLPDDIILDITELAIGDSIKIRDLDIPGVEFLEPEVGVIIMIKTARGATAEELAEEEAAEAAAAEAAAEAAAAEGGEGAEGAKGAKGEETPAKED